MKIFHVFLIYYQNTFVFPLLRLIKHTLYTTVCVCVNKN